MEENRLALDTHVWVSIFHRSREEDLINAIPSKHLLLVSCEEQIKELLHIIAMREELKAILTAKPEQYARFIRSVTKVAHVSKRFSLLHDYKDNYLVDLCWQTNSKLVSDDAGFKPLKKMKRPRVEVMSKIDFYKMLAW